MTLNLKPYPEYKKSGISWIGDVPVHWSVLPNRAIFREIIDRAHTKEQLLSVTITRGVIQQSDLLSNSSKKDSSNEDKSNYKLVLSGDITYNKMRAWQGAIGVSKYRGIVSPAYIVVRLRQENNPGYFHYLYRTQFFAKEAERWSYGITSDQWSLRAEDFKQIYSVVPPVSEQIGIVKYLDRIDYQVRHYIQAKRRQIALLNEQKRSFIHHAVIHGLNPTKNVKSSGVEWLGNVPNHWDIAKLNRLASFQRGFDITQNQQIVGKIPVVSSGGISSYHNQFTSRGPGVLLGRKGSVGTVYYIETDYWAHDTTLWVKNFNGNYPKYVYYLMMIFNLEKFDTGSSNPTINRNLIHQEPVVIPPFVEQEKIARFLDKEIIRIDAIVNNIKLIINYLIEYRSCLISEVVTGKLDVRGIKLPILPKAEDNNQELNPGPEEAFKGSQMDLSEEETDAND